MATKLITLVGGPERWDGQVVEVAATGQGVAERSGDEGRLVRYVDTGEIEQIPITVGAPGREKTSLKKVHIYRYAAWRLPGFTRWVAIEEDDDGQE